MGSPRVSGQRQKHPDALTFRRGGRVKALQPVEVTDVSPSFDAPAGLLPESAQIWNQTLELARAHLMPTDIFAARRWIHWVNEWFKTVERIEDEGTTVAGTRGTTVLNPDVFYLKTCEANIVHAETTMGLNPQARMRLGITYVEEQSALERLKQIGTGTARPKPARMGSAKQ